MSFGDLNSKIQGITSGAGSLLTTLFGLTVVVGAIAIVVLSIIMMFTDEQAAQRYKRWRMNVIKAVAVALCVSLIFALIKGLLSEWWGKGVSI